MPISAGPGQRTSPVHPGEVLREEFMKPLGLSANALAMALRVPVTRISEIVRERRAISVETAMRLGQYFGTSTEFWINVQTSWEVAIAQDMLPRIRAEVQPAAHAPHSTGRTHAPIGNRYGEQAEDRTQESRQKEID